MEKDKKTREPLDDDALGEVTGGSTDAVVSGFIDVDGGYIEAHEKMKGLVYTPPGDGKF